MKILHTADLHLTAVGDEHWNALETIVNICVMEKVDIFVTNKQFNCNFVVNHISQWLLHP